MKIELLEGILKKAPRRFLKLYVEDKWNAEPIPLFFHKRTVPQEHAQPDDYEVEKILKHRQQPDGTEEYLTLWAGHDPSEATWEPLNTFVPHYNSEWVKYLKEKKLHPQITKALHDTPFRRG